MSKRLCIDCWHMEIDKGYCHVWERRIPPTTEMTPEHDCPHYEDLFDAARAGKLHVEYEDGELDNNHLPKRKPLKFK